MLDFMKIENEDGEVQIPVELCIVNDNSALSAAGAFLAAEETPNTKVQVIIDQIVPPNDPKISSDQRKLMAFSNKYDLDFHYGDGMTTALLAETGLSAGTVVVSCDPEIAMVGGLGACGICVSEEQLPEVMKTGKLTLKDVKTAELKVTGSLQDGVSVKNAALDILQNVGTQRYNGKLLLLTGAPLNEMTDHQRMVLCGVLTRTGALSVICAEKAECADSMVVDLTAVRRNVVLTPDYSKIARTELVPAEEVKAVFIGGEYGGSLDDMEKAAEILKGKKVKFGLRLSVVPNSAEVYIEAANRGYLKTMVEAGALILNQCASAKIQARIGATELMVSNNIHNEEEFAGPAGSRIYLTSTPVAAECALTGQIGGRK